MTGALPRLTLSLTLLCSCTLQATAADLREAVPADVYVAVYGRYNPERDYMNAYYEEIKQTVQETQIIEKFMEAVESSVGGDEFAQFESIRNELKDALEPVQWDAFANCSESIYAQKLAVPSTQHLVMLRVGEPEAKSIEAGAINLFKLAREKSDGAFSISETEVKDVTLTSLLPPVPQVPFSLTVGTSGDIIIFASTSEFAQEGIALLNNPGAESKFDDPRLAEALSKLPEFEDSLVFFDGKELLEQLHQIPQFIRNVSQGDPATQPVITLLESAYDQFGIFDYEVTVEYTEGFQNRTAAYGRLQPGSDTKVLGQVLTDQDQFQDWSRWVPARASSFSLSGGAHLRPAYLWLMEMIPEHFPQIQPGIERLEAIQEGLDVHLDADLLQAFSGESVSISMPGTVPSAFGAPAGQSVTFLKCSKPDRIRELLHRLFDTLAEIPQLKSQGIGLKPVEGMEGYEQITANLFAMVGIQPVIGFHEGWMVIGSHADAVKTVLKTKSGEGASFADTATFKKFDMPIEGPVSAISYANKGDSTRAAARTFQQVGAMLPMFIGMAGADAADLQQAQKFLALLPSIGKIIGKFDFYEYQLSVTQPGAEPFSYTRRSVTLIRPPAAKNADEATNK